MKAWSFPVCLYVYACDTYTPTIRPQVHVKVWHYPAATRKWEVLAELEPHEHAVNDVVGLVGW